MNKLDKLNAILALLLPSFYRAMHIVLAQY